MPDTYPRRIICLTDETTEILYLLGQEDRIVGISGFTQRPPRARKEKRIVSGFVEARIDDICELAPDLVIGFSDIQADIARQLIAAGLNVYVSNHRSVAGILQFVRTVGALIGQAESAHQLADRLEAGLEPVPVATGRRRPRVYFEEWNDPLISGIEWVSELIQLAGGDDVCHATAKHSLAKDRVIADPSEVISWAPDIIVASWCGKPVERQQILERKGWHDITAVKNQQIHELDSSIILQPGPAALTDGVSQLKSIIRQWHDARFE